MQLAARQSLAQCTAAAGRPAPLPDLRNRIYTIHFAYASTEVSVPDAELNSLVAEARNAVQIVLRARTDGKTDSVGEIRVAKGRAAAVKRYLAQAGVDLSRIRSTWQPSGDPVADNDTPEGRALNRRVEVEIYRTAPLVWH
jgi:outer membrane protein OmpA-like peptidoglycan-associated protein